MKVSYFHDYYKEHAEELKIEINEPGMKIDTFLRKYKIGSGIFNYYLAGVKIRSGRTKGKTISMKERFEGMRLSDRQLYTNRRKEIADKFGLPDKDIQNLVDEGFTLSEIESGELVDGKIKPAVLVHINDFKRK